MTVPEHLEYYLGRITHGIKSGNNNKVNTVIFRNTPENKLTTYATLGLSKHCVNYKSRFELIFVSSSNEEELNLANMLIWLADFIIEQHRPILCGEVIYLPETISPESAMDALYVSCPFYFPDDFQVLEAEDNDVVFPLLIPVYKSEAKNISQNGWSKFEQFLVDNDIDNLWDLQRKSFEW